jgi:hypothetical protein
MIPQSSHLYNAAHEAGVAQIDEPPQAQPGVLGKFSPPRIGLQQANLLVQQCACVNQSTYFF